MKNADFRGFVSKSSQNYNFFRASITFENQLVVDELDRVVISKAQKITNFNAWIEFLRSMIRITDK